MALDELLKVIETLRKRAQDHTLKAKLQQEEALTRYVLVDPLLRALGWDTGDPEQVYPEYPVSGRVDYALLSGGKPVMFIEVKSVGGDLKTARAQAITRFQNVQVPYFAITDGLQWEVCDTSKPLGQITVLAFDLSDKDAANVCLQAASLWALRYGELATSTQLTPPSTTAPPLVAMSPPDLAPSRPVQTPSSRIAETGSGSVSLADFRPEPGDRVPSRVRLPDGTEEGIRTQKDILVVVVRWLVKTRVLTANHCPIYRQGANRYIVNIQPTHRDGRPFEQRVEIPPLWIDTKYAFPLQVDNARLTIARVGLDPRQFQLHNV